MPKKIADIRRPEIVQALYAAIEKYGLSAPSYDLVAREGDMSRQLVRHYYRDPEQMVVDLCDYLAAIYRDHLLRGVIQAEGSSRLGVFLDFYFDFLAGKGLPKPKDDRVYDALFALAGPSERVRSKLKQQYSELIATLSHEIHITYPDLDRDDTRELAYLVVSLMYGHWKMVATLGMSEDLNGVSRRAIDRLIDSYTKSATLAEAV